MKHNFKNLEIWLRSRRLVKDIYLATKKFPKDETFGLTSQIRRAAISIPSNIAEGCGRSTNPQVIHFMDIAIASCCEIETQIFLSYDLTYLNESGMIKLSNEVTEIRKMIIGFQNKHK